MTALRITAYRLRRDLGSLSEARGRTRLGDILINGRVLILHCPACVALQFTPRAISGHDDAPNILDPVQCGAGACRRCGIWFRIVTGRPEVVAPPVATMTSIPGPLAAAGVMRPPKQPE